MRRWTGASKGRFTQGGLCDDCYALCLPYLSLGRVGPVGAAFWGGVRIWGLGGMLPVVGGSVGRVLFSLGIRSMLSGPSHLLSALALGMCVLGLVVDPPILSFLCLLAAFMCWPFPLFVVCHLVSVLLFPCVFLGPWGLLAWEGIAGGLVLWRIFVVAFLLLQLAARS